MMNNMQPNTQGQQYAGASLGQVPQSRRMHPLMAGAAVAVIIASVTAVAAITGVLPTSKATQGSTNPNAAAQSASAPLALAAPGQTAASNQAAPTYPAQPSAVHHAVHHPAPSYAEHNPSSNNDYAQPRPAANPYAGQVTAITPIATQQGNETGLGMIGGAVVGGLLGNQVGKGNGRTLATVAGAVGGGYAGHEAENYYHRDTSYNVSVRMDNGATRTFTYKAAPGFQVGDRVHVENGSLAAG
ncbi:glycine zipper 2TM domain-containing protein [Ralstonia nicotianae]|uniref:glycine zipper 2TM domain-containing protein n=1 Tax=Ralstonia solanacearum species complex TaxID=3116862 RepID=UPI000381EE3B|nr:glycine zipper 2TM domain-containing protein [Ralstonia pseudosolanacearum]MCK4125769.1 glycine zipper 2TM domain-containing protein [Ralstonia pseudosolanacearum]QIK17901.1 glycine zipper 2TM domain-containing protein [Ralstonia solanacearum]